MLYEASREVFVQNRVHYFDHKEIYAIGARGHRGAVRWDRNFECQEGARPKSVDDVEIYICKLDHGVSQLGHDVWVPSRTVGIE